MSIYILCIISVSYTHLIRLFYDFILCRLTVDDFKSMSCLVAQSVTESAWASLYRLEIRAVILFEMFNCTNTKMDLDSSLGGSSPSNAIVSL